MHVCLDPQAELSGCSSAGLESWLAGEIWLKSAWLIIRLKLAFYDFFADSRCNW